MNDDLDLTPRGKKRTMMFIKNVPIKKPEEVNPQEQSKVKLPKIGNESTGNLSKPSKTDWRRNAKAKVNHMNVPKDLN